MFKVWTIIADRGVEKPRKGDRFLMQVFVEKGYSRSILLRLNRVRVFWKTLFVLDILTASGNKIDPEVLGRPQVSRRRSHLRRPTEHPDTSDFQTWRDAILALCPSRIAGMGISVFIAPSHRIWGVEMGWGLRMPAPVQCRRRDGGCLPPM